MIEPETTVASRQEARSLHEVDRRHRPHEEKSWADEEGWWWWLDDTLDTHQWIPVLVTLDGRVFVPTEREDKWTLLKHVAAGGGCGRWLKAEEPPDWEMPSDEALRREGKK